MSRSEENADMADVHEQRRPVTDDESGDPASSVPPDVADIEADEADRMEQAATVLDPDEDYPPDGA